MSATATIAITVGVAVAVLVGFFIVYYLGNVANSIYDVKVGVRKDFDKKIKELQDWVDKDTKQRINWMRDENKEDSKRFKESMEGHLEETVGELSKEVERLRADVTSLQHHVQNLKAGKGAKAAMPQDGGFTPALKRTPGREPGPGDLEVPRMGVPESEVAPDMAVSKEDTVRAPSVDGPTPVSKKKTARAAAPSPSTATKKRKKRAPRDEFESFDQFSEDFKAGS